MSETIEPKQAAPRAAPAHPDVGGRTAAAGRADSMVEPGVTAAPGEASAAATPPPSETRATPQPVGGTAPPRETPAARKRLRDFPLTASVQNLKSISVNLLLIFSVLLALPVSYKIIARNSLTINEFTVPSGVEGRGMSGKVLAQRLHDELIAASRFTSRQIETQGSTPVALEEKLPRIDLPIEGLNLALIVPQLRALFGFRDASIAGELVVEQPGGDGRPELYGLRLRAPGEGAIYRSAAPSDNVDHLLRDAAIIILQREDPIVAAYYYLFRRDFKAARRMADVAGISANPKTQLLATHVKGLIARGLNEWPEAAEHFRDVIKSNPDFRTGYSNLASAARRFDLDEADAVSHEMIRRFPDYWLGYNNLALVRLTQRRVPEAIQVMAKAETIAPRDPEMHFQRQFFLRAMGQHEAAIAALQLAQDLNPTAIHYLEETARLQRDLGKAAEALAAATRIAAIEPTNPQGHALVARLLLDAKEFDRAEQAIARALAIEPDFAPALAERGRMQTLRESWREAEASFARADKADPRLTETWEYWGDLHLLRDNEDEAVAAFRKAIEFGTYPAWRAASPNAKLGTLLEKAGDLPGAMQAYDRAYRLDRRKYATLPIEVERLKQMVESAAQSAKPAGSSN